MLGLATSWSCLYLLLHLAFEKGLLPFCEQGDWFWFLSLTQARATCVTLNRYLSSMDSVFSSECVATKRLMDKVLCANAIVGNLIYSPRTLS